MSLMTVSCPPSRVAPLHMWTLPLWTAILLLVFFPPFYDKSKTCTGSVDTATLIFDDLAAVPFFFPKVGYFFFFPDWSETRRPFFDRVFFFPPPLNTRFLEVRRVIFPGDEIGSVPGDSSIVLVVPFRSSSVDEHSQFPPLLQQSRIGLPSWFV